MVEKLTTDRAFSKYVDRQRDLITLSHRLTVLPRILRAKGSLIVMEFIEGESVRSVMTPEGMDFEEVAQIIHGLGNALHAAHATRLLHV